MSSLTPIYTDGFATKIELKIACENLFFYFLLVIASSEINFDGQISSRPDKQVKRSVI